MGYRRARRMLVALLATLLWASGQAAGLPPAVAQKLREAQVPVEALSVWLAPLEGKGRQLILNPDTPRNPASVMKLVTSYAALATFGPSHQWRVALAAAAQQEGETLYGPLLLEHDGDPALTAERLWTLLRTARAHGIRRIAGFRVQGPPLHLPPWDSASFDGRGDAPYTQGPSATLAHYNAIIVTLAPTINKAGLVAVVHPPLPLGVDVHDVRRTDEACPTKAREFLTATFTADRLQVRGRYPRACGPLTLAVAPPDPDRFAEAILQAIWQELGGEIDPTLPNRPATPHRLAVSDSPTLTELLFQMNKWSNNVIARQLLALVGFAADPTAADHVAAGRQEALRLLRAAGLDDGKTVIDNGAGLSRTERITARTLARLLTHVAQQEFAAEFVVGLPRLGEDGTARRRYRNHPLQGQAHLKTGTLRDVRALAGFARDRKGRRYAVVMLLEHPNAAAAAEVFPLLLGWLIER